MDRDRIWSGYVSYKDINDYLNAADFGLLLREDTPTNNVASPTKFAEYLMAGLPTLISQGVGDLSEFVEQNPSSGMVVDNEARQLVDTVASYIDSTQISKNATAKLGRVNFSKNALLGRIVTIYESYC